MPRFFIPARNTRHRTACECPSAKRKLGRALNPDFNQVLLCTRPFFARPSGFLSLRILQPALAPLILSNTLYGARSAGTRTTPASGLLCALCKMATRWDSSRHRDTPRDDHCNAIADGILQFLDLLTAAQTASSPQYASILSFLSARLASRQEALARRSAAASSPPRLSRPSRASALHPERVPLLRLVSAAKPGSPPVYEPTARPLPLGQLSGGVRKPPRLDETGGIPFLRIGKPQSPGLSRVLRQKSWKRQVRTTRIIQLTEQDAVEAEWEDKWEKTVGGLLNGEKEGETLRVPREGTFVESVRENIAYLNGKLGAERKDSIARGKAMWKIVEAERALAEEEKAEREKQGPRRKEGLLGKAKPATGKDTTGRETLKRPEEPERLDSPWRRGASKAKAEPRRSTRPTRMEEPQAGEESRGRERPRSKPRTEISPKFEVTGPTYRHI